jgi:hypothetical protein
LAVGKNAWRVVSFLRTIFVLDSYWIRTLFVSLQPSFVLYSYCIRVGSIKCALLYYSTCITRMKGMVTVPVHLLQKRHINSMRARNERAQLPSLAQKRYGTVRAHVARGTKATVVLSLHTRKGLRAFSDNNKGGNNFI